MSNKPTRSKPTPEQLKGYRRPRIMPGTFVHNQAKNEYKTRFSQVFKPAGHNFVKAFTVIYAAYWMKYGLLEYEDVNLYSFLCYLAEEDMLFTIEGLVHLLHQSKETVRASLDRLENAELIYCYKQDDVHGRPNYYVIRTPLYESAEALTDRVRGRIHAAGEKLPGVFLVDEVERLRAAIEENTAKKRRRDPAAYPEAQEFKRFWNDVRRAFGKDDQRAVNFDNIVADILTEFRGRSMTLDVFDKCLEHECKLQDIDLKRRPKLKELAHRIRAFYDNFESEPPARKERQAPASAAAEEQIETFRQMLESGWTLEQLTAQFSGGFSATEWAKMLRSLRE